MKKVWTTPELIKLDTKETKWGNQVTENIDFEYNIPGIGTIFSFS